MDIRIATCPFSWGVWNPDGGPAYVPHETFLQQASECGYQEIELGPDGYLPMESDTLKSELRKYQLNVCAGTATIPFYSLEKEECRAIVTPLAQRLKALGVSDMVVMDGSLFGDDKISKSDWDQEKVSRIYDKILDINQFLKESFGIRMLFHPHASSAIEFESEIDKMMSMGDIHLCFDTGHHVYSNGGTEKNDQTVFDFLRRYQSRIPYLHFKNADGAVLKQVRENHWSLEYAFSHGSMCNLEDGIINFETLRDYLAEINYQGIAVIEQDMAGKTGEYACQCAKLNLRYLQKIGMI